MIKTGYFFTYKGKGYGEFPNEETARVAAGIAIQPGEQAFISYGTIEVHEQRLIGEQTKIVGVVKK